MTCWRNHRRSAARRPQEKIERYVRNFAKGIRRSARTRCLPSHRGVLALNLISIAGGPRSFCNKLWNTRTVLMVRGQDVGLDDSAAVELSFVDRWASAACRKRKLRSRRARDYRFDLAARAV